jgi:hypothetical protein
LNFLVLKIEANLAIEGSSKLGDNRSSLEKIDLEDIFVKIG